MRKEKVSPPLAEGNKKESLQETLSQTVKALEAGQTYHAEKAQQYGVAKDVIIGFYELTKTVPEESLQLFVPGFQKYETVVREKERDQSRFDPSSGAIAMAGASTSVGATTYSQNVSEFIRSNIQPPEFWDRQRSEAYAKRLQGLDPELSLLFRGIGASFWGDIQGAERNASGQARQFFDHLFSKLAPDDEVRNSSFFTEKVGDKPLQVHRSERLRYAAATRIKGKSEADFLSEQASEMLAAYDNLQLLHDRKPIDRDRARAVLQTFVAAIEQWVDALDLP